MIYEEESNENEEEIQIKDFEQALPKMEDNKCHAPNPRLGGRGGCETILGLYTFFSRHWWA